MKLFLGHLYHLYVLLNLVKKKLSNNHSLQQLQWMRGEDVRQAGELGNNQQMQSFALARRGDCAFGVLTLSAALVKVFDEEG